MAVSYPIANHLDTSVSNQVSFLWLEITGKCNLACTHCYAGSSPQGNHGSMQLRDWEQVILQAARLGCKHIQFIGGEPSVHPHLPHLIRFASQKGMQVEVYSNLVSIKSEHWEVFQECHVHIATSFYSISPFIHEQITGGHASFQKTVGNITQTLALGLPLRVGMIEMRPDQNIKETETYLRNLGVTRIKTDRVRSVGRGETYIQVEDPRQALCGACARGKACVVPSGDVYPCVFSRWMNMGNVLKIPFQEIIVGKRMVQTRQELTSFFVRQSNRGSSHEACQPDEDACMPEGAHYRAKACQPDEDGCMPESPRMQINDSPCMPATEPYLKTQDLSTIITIQASEPCDPNCEPGQSGCNPDNQGCPPTNLCVPDFKDPCGPAQPCPPDQEACPPDWDQ